MNRIVDVVNFSQVNTDEVYEHIYELYVTHKPRDDQHLGYINKSQPLLQISCAHEDLSITQSLSGLNSQASSTGFICWQTTSYVVDWLLTDEKCPFGRAFSSDESENKHLSVLELGSGVSSITTSVLGPRTKHFVASDQKHILKLLKQNFNENVTSRCTSSTNEQIPSTVTQTVGVSRIDFIEYDWEFTPQGMHNYHNVTNETQLPDLIIACDTIYNEYLITPFLDACRAAMNADNAVLVGIQLRDESVIESFLTKTLEAGFQMYYIPPDMLSNELVNGFVVYYITL